MATITVLILTQNEEEILPACLKRIKWADEILIIDSGSTDNTTQIAKAARAKIHYHPFKNFADQCNHGLSQASSDWILQVDADEFVTPELAASIRKTISANPTEDIFNLRRDACAWGKFMKASSWSGEWIPRLFRKGTIQFKGDVHQDPQVDGRPVGKLSGKLLHYSYRSTAQYFKKFELYSTLWATNAHAHGRRTSIPGAMASGLWRVFHNYFIRGEIRDGRIGLVMSLLSGMHTFIRHIKLWGLQNAGEFAQIYGDDNSQNSNREKHNGKLQTNTRQKSGTGTGQNSPESPGSSSKR